MSATPSRRHVLAGAVALGLLPRSALAGSLQFGPPEPFSFDALKARAKALAAAPHKPTEVRFDDLLERVDYDAFQQIRFRPENALWADGSGSFPVQFFHLGRYFKLPVAIHAVDRGEARRIAYSADLFDLGTSTFVSALPADIGFAGFRVMAPDGKTDWLAFLGAAYFRSSGQLDQYGLSARAVAIDTAMPTPEEFPRFTDFWLETPPNRPDSLIIYTLMDGPSIAGALRIACTRKAGVTMEIDAALYARTDIARLGVAPLTSMFWYSETNRHQARDWRPEIHDSDGLALWTGAGERIWRPLNNPTQVQTSSFVDSNPRGFGLLQRDRKFENYQDDGVFYDRRPSVWVEPLDDWGEGAVQLVEIPTDDEIHDNIVAYWVPKRPATAGSAWDFRYRLHWLADAPQPGTLGRVTSVRLGRGGVPGQPRPPAKKKIVVDFAGGQLAGLHSTEDKQVELAVEASAGKIDGVYTLPVVGTKRWRGVFDLEVQGSGPVEIRAFLHKGGTPLTETLLYQFLPFNW
jgi:glucans biosynthesis protein